MMINKILEGILYLFIAFVFLMLILVSIKIYKTNHPKEEPTLFDTYQKSFYIESYNPPKHFYIDVRYTTGKTETLYVSKHCNKREKLHSIINEKKLVTVIFDTYRYVDYDGVLSFYDRQRVKLYDILCT